MSYMLLLNGAMTLMMTVIGGHPGLDMAPIASSKTPPLVEDEYSEAAFAW